MKNSQRKTEIKVGIVTIVSIALFIVGLMLARNIGVSSAPNKLVFRFGNSGGLKESDPIVINGVERGSVTGVLNSNGCVIVLGEIDDIGDLKSDASAKIAMLEITGGKKVEIVPGTSPSPFNLKDTIPGVRVFDLPEMLSEADLVVRDLKLLINRLDTTASSVNSILADKSLLADIRTTVTSSKEMIAALNSVIQANKQDIAASIKNLRSASSALDDLARSTGVKADTLIDNVNNIIASAEKLVSRTGTIEDNLDVLIKNYNAIALDIKNGKGTVSTLLYDEKFSAEFQKTMAGLKALLNQIEKYGINANVRIGARP